MQRTVARVLEEKQSGDIFGTRPDASVYEALEMMAEKNVGALIVLDEGRLVGIMSERDYARKIILLNRLSRDTKVSEIMTQTVLTVTLDQSMVECMELMTDRRVRHLPVMEGDEVVGVVSIGDVVRAVIQEQQFMIQQLESYITG
jgi:CBS domain-containing protein